MIRGWRLVSLGKGAACKGLCARCRAGHKNSSNKYRNNTLTSSLEPNCLLRDSPSYALGLSCLTTFTHARSFARTLPESSPPIAILHTLQSPSQHQRLFVFVQYLLTEQLSHCAGIVLGSGPPAGSDEGLGGERCSPVTKTKS